MRVDALIGEGGFASIYRVQDQTTTQVRPRAADPAQAAQNVSASDKIARHARRNSNAGQRWTSGCPVLIMLCGRC